MGKNIYLSLDDLHKLYGISSAVINAIKAKRKKRRIKKLKINNGTIGSKASSSDHMGGSSSLAISTAQLNKANIDKRIEDINKNNLLIEDYNKKKNENNNNFMIENKKTEDIPIEIQIYNKLKNKELLTPTELIEYENMKNMMFQPENKPKKKYIRGRKTFSDNPEIIITNPLASINQSNIMGRMDSTNTITLDETDNIGGNSNSTSSDNFINNNTEEFLIPELIDIPIDVPIETVDVPIESVDVPPVDVPVDVPSVDVQAVEETKIDTSNDQPESIYKPISSFTVPILKEMAKTNNVPTFRNITKPELYDLLLDAQLIPLK